MNRAFDLSIGICAAAFAFQISRTAQFQDFADRILDHLVALDDVPVLKPDFAARSQAEIFRRRALHKVVTLDIYFPTEFYLAGPRGRILRIVDGIQFLGLKFRVIGQNDFYWSQYG